jgi:hypothetical protein
MVLCFLLFANTKVFCARWQNIECEINNMLRYAEMIQFYSQLHVRQKITKTAMRTSKGFNVTTDTMIIMKCGDTICTSVTSLNYKDDYCPVKSTVVFDGNGQIRLVECIYNRVDMCPVVRQLLVEISNKQTKFVLRTNIILCDEENDDAVDSLIVANNSTNVKKKEKAKYNLIMTAKELYQFNPNYLNAQFSYKKIRFGFGNYFEKLFDSTSKKLLLYKIDICFIALRKDYVNRAFNLIFRDKSGDVSRCIDFQKGRLIRHIRYKKVKRSPRDNTRAYTP